MKHWVLASLLLVSFVIAGCPAALPDVAPVAEPEPEPEEVATIRFITGVWVPEPLGPHIQRFEEETGIRVIVEDYPFRELFETIEVRARAEVSDIDVIFVDAPLVPSYAARGLLHPLDDVITQQEIEETWPEMAIESGYWDGQLWAPPINNSSQVLFYNIDLLEAAGIEPPPADVDERWTWEHLVEVAQELTDQDEGIWGFTFDQVNRYYQLQVLPESLGGGSGVSPDGLSVRGHLTNPEWVEAFTFYHDLFNTWNVSPKGVPVEGISELFEGGRVALFVGGLWNIPSFLGAEVNFGVAPHPYFAQGQPITPTNSWNVGVWRWTEQPELAAQFTRFLTMDPDVAVHWLLQHGQFPSHWAALEVIDEDPRYAEQPRIAYRIAAHEAATTAVTRARTPAFLEFEEILSDTFEDIRNGADPAVALGLAEDRIEAAMARYR